MTKVTSGKTLSGRIFALLFSLSFVVMLVATVAATAACFNVYEKQAEELLLSQAESCADSLKGETADEMIASLQDLPLVEVRCTLVAEDGTVLYDSEAEASAMGNHADRSEIAQAKEGGSAVALRKSATLGFDTLYAACQVDSGMVLRLAETRTSLASFLAGMSWQLLISLLVIFLVSLFASRAITKRIVQPLREIDLSDPLKNAAYEELQPLLGRVDEQRRELEEQNDELEHAVAIRREFTSNVSHEMKTPLQVIGGYAELMEAGMVKQEDVGRFAGLIRSEAESMRVLIDDVLTLSRLDEHAQTTMNPVCLAQVCKRVMRRLAAQAEERDITLVDDLDESVRIMGDEGLAEQLAYNLVDNAIRYNKQGGRIWLTVRSEGSNAILSVADEGPGVPPELRERVFERFYRVDTSRSRETGGTGLGLAIVKHGAESFGGSVSITDAESGGACFVFRAPLASS